MSDSRKNAEAACVRNSKQRARSASANRDRWRDQLQTGIQLLLLLCVSIFTFVLSPSVVLGQLPKRGTPERAEFDRAFFGRSHFLNVRMEYLRNEKEGVVAGIVECRGATHTPAIGSGEGSYQVKIPSRTFLNSVLADGSRLILHLPPDICGLWFGKWMDAKFAKYEPTETRYPEDFTPLIYWADRTQDPGRLEMYVSRLALVSPHSAILFRRLTFAVLASSESEKWSAQARREERDDLPHPLSRYNATRSKTPWRSSMGFLQGVPEALWSQYPGLVALINARGKSSDARCSRSRG